MKITALCSAAFLLALVACNSGKYLVADADFYTDGFKLSDKVIQLVESKSDKADNQPAEGRYRQNCDAAENQARVRFQKDYPTARDQGKRLGERFEKNAGCTVRMAFRTD